MTSSGPRRALRIPGPLRRALMIPGLLRRAGPGRLRRAQLRTRVLAGVLPVTLIALVAFDIAAVTALRGYLVSHTDSQLETVLSLYRPLDVAVQEPLPFRAAAGRSTNKAASRSLPKRASEPKWVIVGPHVYLPPALGAYYVVFVSGRGPQRLFVRGNPGLVPRLPGRLRAIGASQHAETVTSVRGNAPLRLRAVRAGGGTLLVTTSLAEVNKTVGRLTLILIIGSLAAGLLVALGVGWLVRRGLRPIEAMATQADRITAGDLTDRVSPQDPGTEVGRLGAALNGMLTRIETSIREREASQELTRRFFADASHELRNPLASLRANAELYQQGALSQRPQVDEAMHRIALEAQRMSGLVDDMLRLARLDQQPGQQHEQVDLSAVITGCAERAQITDPERTWHAHIATGLVAFGDEELLRRAVDNLLANVHAHTPPGTVATITGARRGSTVAIEVSDNGPGVPAGQLPRIFDRFYRATAQAHRPGSGLGLAIVTAIAAAHDGTAEAALNHPHGLRMSLTLPACGPPSPAEAAAVSQAASAHASPGAPGRSAQPEPDPGGEPV